VDIRKLKKLISDGEADCELRELYTDLADARKRIIGAIDSFSALYGEDRDVALFSVPGRTEISGNHTDHNNGKVIAAAVNLDLIAVASKNDRDVINITGEGFPSDTVKTDSVEIDETERYTSRSLIKGTVAGFCKRGLKVGGFDAYTTSDVKKGSGLSSSAVFEVTVGCIINSFFNNDMLSPEELAVIAQYAENEYFGKPSGLMDQTACAVGGLVAIDFKDPAKADVKKLDSSFIEDTHSVCITDVGSSHDDLNEEYASIPKEMKLVAKELSSETLRGTDCGKLIERLGELRAKFGDRAVLRAMHFFEENDRVAEMTKVAEQGFADEFIKGVAASGRSSILQLQNICVTGNSKEQSIAVAIALSEKLLKGKNAAVRVHGGGFAGTIMALVPCDYAETYKMEMDKVLGANSCRIMKIRKNGAYRLKI